MSDHNNAGWPIIHSMLKPAMPKPADIQVLVADAAHTAAIRKLQVAPSQTAFVGDIAFNLVDAQRDRLSDAMAIVCKGEVVGFYRLDRAPRTVIGRRLAQPHLGLRAFMIDHNHQGRGLGTLAMRACCADASRRHPRHGLLALTVSCDNVAARAAYARAGFRDTGETYPGGAAPAEHLMLYHLRGFTPDPHSLPGPNRP